MNGAHDLGGGHGHGPIAPDPNEPLFHAGWERKAFSLTLAMGFTGQWNIDQARFARESMAPGRYLETTYYEHWLHGLEVLLAERALVSEAEIQAAESIGETKPLPRILNAADVLPALQKGGSAKRDESTAGQPPTYGNGSSRPTAWKAKIRSISDPVFPRLIPSGVGSYVVSVLRYTSSKEHFNRKSRCSASNKIPALSS